MSYLHDLDIIRVVELHDYEEVNTHIDRGWKLLSVQTKSVTDHHQQTIYVLGLPRSSQSSVTTFPGNSAESLPFEKDDPGAIEQKPVNQQDQMTQSSRGTFQMPSEPTQSIPQSKRWTLSPDTSISHTPTSPITLVSRIALKETSTKQRRKKNDPPQREPTEKELHERAAWREVQETGKPVLLDDKLLIPDGMSPWEAIEFLPDRLREQTRAALQHRVSEAFMVLVRSVRERLSTPAETDTEYEKFNSFPYAAQMAIAENIARQQLGIPEGEMRELLKQYGALIEDDQNMSTQ